MTKLKDLTGSAFKKSVQRQHMLFKEFDDCSKATILGELVDLRVRLHHIKLYTVYKTTTDPNLIDSDIESVIKDIRVLLERLLRSVEG